MATLNEVERYGRDGMQQCFPVPAIRLVIIFSNQKTPVLGCFLYGSIRSIPGRVLVVALEYLSSPFAALLA